MKLLCDSITTILNNKKRCAMCCSLLTALDFLAHRFGVKKLVLAVHNLGIYLGISFL